MSGLILFIILILSPSIVLSSPAEITAGADARYMLSAHAGDRPGKIEITESRSWVVHDDKIHGKLPVTIAIRLKHTDLVESLDLDLPSHLKSKSASLGIKFPVPFTDTDNYFIGVDLIPTQNTDGWDWENSAFRLPFRTFLIYRANDNFIIAGGVAVRIDYENEILPFAGVIYRPTDRLSINIASDEPSISYKITERLTLLGEMSLVSDEYEVKRNGQKGLVLQYRQIGAGFGASYKFNESLSTLFSLGNVFARKLEYEGDGEEVCPEPSFYVKAQATVTL